jgi:antitoxin component YwqK of YwqJK toxin-antitoxin module
MKPKLKEEFYPNGKVRYQKWTLNGKLHNEEGPAIIRYHKNGNIQYQVWYLNDKWHNEEGPARVSYHKDGKVMFKEWCLDGKELTKEDFTSLDMIKRVNAFELFSPIEIARLKINQ